MNYQDLEHRVEVLEDKIINLQFFLHLVVSFLIGGFLTVLFKKYF